MQILLIKPQCDFCKILFILTQIREQSNIYDEIFQCFVNSKYYILEYPDIIIESKEKDFFVMQSQKLNAELNLALETSSVERERSENLAVGYNPETREWELIIRYLGDISFLQSVYGATVTELLGGYAIVVIKEQFIDGLIEHKEIIYVEKPNNVFLNVQEEKRVSCINRLYLPASDLSGQGIVVAVID